MTLGHRFIAQLRASEAKTEIRQMGEFARRSIGQSIRWARVKLATPTTNGGKK